MLYGMLYDNLTARCSIATLVIYFTTEILSVPIDSSEEPVFVLANSLVLLWIVDHGLLDPFRVPTSGSSIDAIVAVVAAEVKVGVFVLLMLIPSLGSSVE